MKVWFRFHVLEVLRNAFKMAVLRNGEASASAVMRRFMERYVADTEKSGFARP